MIKPRITKQNLLNSLHLEEYSFQKKTKKQKEIEKEKEKACLQCYSYKFTCSTYINITIRMFFPNGP